MKKKQDLDFVEVALDDAAAQQLRSEAFASLREVYQPRATAKPVVSVNKDESSSEQPLKQFVLCKQALQCHNVVAGVESQHDQAKNVLATVLVRRVDQELQISSLAVGTAWRNLGLARVIVDRLMQWTLKRHPEVTTCTLWCVAETSNPDTFTKLGFNETHREVSKLFTLNNGESATEVKMEITIE